MTVVYVQNKIPHKNLRNMKPKEAFTKVKPEIGHFEIFGCPSYIHVPKEKKDQARPFRKKGYICGVQ
jgi:hypothetical protein